MGARYKGVGEALTHEMGRGALNARMLAELSGGLMSESAVRSYLQGATRPRPPKALAIARLLPAVGVSLVRGWGYDELADALDEQEEATTGMPTPGVAGRLPLGAIGQHSIGYAGEELSREQVETVRRFITFLQSGA